MLLKAIRPLSIRLPLILSRSTPVSSQLLLSQSRLQSSVIGETKVDQTKHDNHPGQEKRPDHQQASNTEASDKQSHPAKQADPQKSPERSTGFETEGPDGSKAGKSSEEDIGGVKQKEGKPGKNMEWQG